MGNLTDKYHEMSVCTDDKSTLELFKEFVFELGITCVQEEKNCFIIRDEDSLDMVKFALLEYQKRLENLSKSTIKLDIKTTTKPNRDWIEEYKNGVTPISVGRFYIRPSWYEPKQGATDILIDPALAFGSGHHESTRMCLSLLDEVLEKFTLKHAPSVLDVGCGSGILSIGAAKLGAKVWACDTDEEAINSSISNAKLNGTKFERIWCGSTEQAEQKYDIVVANIIADIILMLRKDLCQLLDVKRGGYLVLSGVIDKYDKEIRDKFSSFKLIKHKQDGDWMSYLYFKKEDNG